MPAEYLRRLTLGLGAEEREVEEAPGLVEEPRTVLDPVRRVDLVDFGEVLGQTRQQGVPPVNAGRRGASSNQLTACRCALVLMLFEELSKQESAMFDVGRGRDERRELREGHRFVAHE